MKTAKQLERHFKGVANHWRIEILLLISEQKNITLDAITERLKGNFKTISEHTKKLAGAGLVNKNYKGRNVAHNLSPYGQEMVRILKKFRSIS